MTIIEMNDEQKKHQLRRYKMLATGLFVLMCCVFLLMTYFQKYQNFGSWVGYVRAFAEAGMVGALADWFAVTALFHHPLGLKIPHTNLIQNKKEQIGDNLGNFVVGNFLSPQNIRPYISKLKVSSFVGEWLSKARNQEILLNETSTIILDILNKLDDEAVINFISKKAQEMTNDLKVNSILGNGLDYILEKNDHQRLVTGLSKQIKTYVLNNQEMVRDRVKKESFALVPKFVDDKIADKITQGLSKYFDEIETNLEHPLREEITQKLFNFSKDLKDNEKWEKELSTIKDSFLKEEKILIYAKDIWESIKKSLMKELNDEDSALKKYLLKNLNELSFNLQNDEKLQYKIDHWIRVTAYKYILKNTHQFGDLISSTVGNWQGKELSNKLELEVGKDLQFIRVNGTLVGGLVGLIIYTIAHFFI